MHVVFKSYILHSLRFDTENALGTGEVLRVWGKLGCWGLYLCHLKLSCLEIRFSKTARFSSLVFGLWPGSAN